MKTEEKVIKLFIENRTPKTIREISKNIQSDYRITYTATQNLIARNIIISKTVGKSTLCELNPSYYGIQIYQAENERKKELLKKSDIKQLYTEIMTKIDSSIFIFLIFGSYATGKSTKNSDIDMMFISPEKDFEEKISHIVSLLPLKTHVLVFTEKEFVRMKDAKKSNVVTEAIESNVILYGVESYYRLKNAE